MALGFPKALVRYIGTPLPIGSDRLPARGSGRVNGFLAAREGHSGIRCLPRRAPELNSVEHVWTDLQQLELPNVRLKGC